MTTVIVEEEVGRGVKNVAVLIELTKEIESLHHHLLLEQFLSFFAQI